MNPKEEYMEKCAEALQKKYGVKTIWVKIIAQSVNGISWFDDLLEKEIEIIGIDFDAIPQRYLTDDGYIPFACAELVYIQH